MPLLNGPLVLLIGSGLRGAGLSISDARAAIEI